MASAREREILDLLAGGLSNAAIPVIRIAPKTVAKNESSIFMKLQVADREQSDRARSRSGPREVRYAETEWEEG